jgi:hypothetical protein
VITRSGTNQFHGSVYEFNEVSALGANAWLNDAARTPKPVTRQNQYGFTIGGPVILPRIFNGKDKLFYFFAFEGIQTSLPEPYNLTVPTLPKRTVTFRRCSPWAAIISYTILTPRYKKALPLRARLFRVTLFLPLCSAPLRSN